MAFIDEMREKLSQAGSSTVQKAKELSELVKLNNEVSELENQICDLYGKIGYEVYCAYCEHPLPEVEELIGQVSKLQEKAAECRERIKELNAASICPKCNAKITKGMAFCSKCGYRLISEEQPEKQKRSQFCVNCGAAVSEGAAFCPTCGSKMGE